ncbi:AGC family protein kinase [Tritrichomonas foetus]|uniref:AGC family protein kinase n=1 Tax=Tritrichomonas foetus TaxID=1144522 RepID=A0A1J4K6G3_9EUKA|nr:AGC family protein kinase [Tritrichomonas foetus]|eukprot:OHT07057.1 AGC family protein kinase [Tritrichomonas foetus]
MSASTTSTLSGNLKKKGAFLGIWNSCYCEMRKNELYVFKNSSSKKPERVIKITPKTKIQMVTGDKAPRLVIENPKESNAVFSCDDESKLLQWVLVLRSATFTSSTVSMDTFRIIAVIGRGFYGKVMLVMNKESNELFALKTIRKCKLVQNKKFYTVLRERNILVKARNPFLVSLYHAFQTDTKFYFVLEYVPGGELFNRMNKEDHIPPNQVKLYVAEVAIAIEYLHSIDIVYRDLKPENVLISKDGHVKLTDFGLSKDLDNEDTTSTFCGTPEYAAPEVIRKNQYGKEIDWWSLGVLTFELLFDRLPFEAPNRPKLFHQILNEEPNFPNLTDPDTKNFISSLLIKDPKKRADFKKIKNHPFFDGLDFDDVANLKVKPEFIPIVDMDPRQKPQNFDSEYTEEQPYDSLAQPVEGAAVHFSGFSFDAESSILTSNIDSSLIAQPVY